MDEYFYLKEVLGIDNILISKELHTKRVIHGSLPCEALVIIAEPLTSTNNQLLKNILKACKINEFTVLEIKDKSLLENFAEEITSKKFAKKVLVFYEELSHALPDDPDFFKTEDLAVFQHADADLKKRKMELWKGLQKWIS